MVKSETSLENLLVGLRREKVKMDYVGRQNYFTSNGVSKMAEWSYHSDLDSYHTYFWDTRGPLKLNL